MFHGRNANGKGDRPCPTQVSREELDLRKSFAWGEISRKEFDDKLERIRDVQEKNA